MMFMWHFIFEAVPKDHDVLLAVLDHEGFHALEFPCRRSNDGRWIDVATGRSIEVHPTHWREWLSDVTEPASVRLAEVTNTASSSATTACTENPASTFRIKRSRIIKHNRMHGSWPVGFPETICEPPHKLVGGAGVVPLALNV